MSAAGAELLGIEGDADEFTVSTLPVGGVVLATASPLDAVRDTLASTRQLLWVVGPALVALVAGLAWLLAGTGPAAGPRRDVAGRGDHVALAARAGAGAGVGRRDRRAGADDERDARPARVGDDVQPPARVGRLARAAHAGGGDAHRAGGRPPVAGTGLGGDGGGAARSSSTGCRASSTTCCCWPAADEQRRGRSQRRSRVARRPRARRRRRGRGASPSTSACPPTVRPPVAGDEPALRRAVDHLVANATRHATARVRVTVESVDGERPPARRRRRARHPGAPAGGRRAALRAPRRGARAATPAVRVWAWPCRPTSPDPTAAICEIADSPLGGARVSLILPGDGQNASAWRSSSR